MNEEQIQRERADLLRRAFHAELENFALQGEDGSEVPVRDVRGGSMLFLTEYDRQMPDGTKRDWCGPPIMTTDLERAEEVGAVLGLRIAGEFKGSFPMDLPIGEMIQRMEEMDVPPDMASDVIDIARDRKAGHPIPGEDEGE